MNTPTKILFICTGNGYRSVIAETYANAWGRGIIEAKSAGVKYRQQVNEFLLHKLAERGFVAEAEKWKPPESVRKDVLELMEEDVKNWAPLKLESPEFEHASPALIENIKQRALVNSGGTENLRELEIDWQSLHSLIYENSPERNRTPSLLSQKEFDWADVIRFTDPNAAEMVLKKKYKDFATDCPLQWDKKKDIEIWPIGISEMKGDPEIESKYYSSLIDDLAQKVLELLEEIRPDKFLKFKSKILAYLDFKKEALRYPKRFLTPDNPIHDPLPKRDISLKPDNTIHGNRKEIFLREERPEFNFEVAISFAGAQRELAEKLAKILQENGVETFYDDFYPEKLWGKNLAEELDRVFRKESRYCVMLISSDYAERMWPQHERRSALDRQIKERGKEYILPVQIDSTDLDGLQKSIGHLNIDKHPIEKIAEILLKKVQSEI